MVARADQRLQKICLALPEATARETWETMTYRVREKIFAMEAQDGGLSVCCKAPEGAQMVLIGADPARFFAPPYVGPKGWIGIRLAGGVDWAEVESLIRRSYRLVAPKKLAMLA